ncbi:MAG: hypothetical protein OXH22_09275 [Chloroflexi bacterium]|nr:hypothetical protein [Chloroflexota bacterium]
MPKKITLTVPEDIAPCLSEFASERGWSEEEVVIDAMKRAVALFRFKKMGDKMAPQARKMGIYTDQDVFNIVS